MSNAIFYVPESEKYPGTYAIGVPTVGGANCTSIISEALQFQTRADCDTWCEKHPYPKFKTVEHAWMDEMVNKNG